MAEADGLRNGKCPLCAKVFGTYRGMRQHLKKSHPRDYNDEMELLASRAKAHGWALADVRLMAAAERRLTAKGCRNINRQLLLVLPHKTFDAIRGKRRKDSYKNLLANTSWNDTELLSDESDTEDEVVPEPSTSQSAVVDVASRDVLDPDSIFSPARNGGPSARESTSSNDEDTASQQSPDGDTDNVKPDDDHDWGTPKRDTGADNLFRPLTSEELSWALKSTKTKSIGPDNIHISVLRRLRLSDLTLLLNGLLMTGNLPETMKECKTILIPKTDEGLENVNNWRPITVGSVVLRTINKVLAQLLYPNRIKSERFCKGRRLPHQYYNLRLCHKTLSG